MADQYDPMKDPLKHKTPDKTLVDKIIELALGAGGGGSYIAVRPFGRGADHVFRLCAV